MLVYKMPGCCISGWRLFVGLFLCLACLVVGGHVFDRHIRIVQMNPLVNLI